MLFIFCTIFKIGFKKEEMQNYFCSYILRKESPRYNIFHFVLLLEIAISTQATDSQSFLQQIESTTIYSVPNGSCLFTAGLPADIVGS